MELFRAEAERIEQYYKREAIDQNKVYRRKRVKNLILDVVTRWNSVYYMLERALEFSEAIDALTLHPKVKIYRPYVLSKADWTVVGQICSWLKSFRSASNMMSAEKYPTLSFSLRVYFILISYVRKLEASLIVQSSPSLLAGVRACEEKLVEVFDKSTYDSEYYFFATNPRFKGSLFRSNQSLTSELFSYDWLEDCTRSLYNICGEYYNTDAPGISQCSDIDATHIPALAQLNDDDDDFIRAWKQQLPQPNQIAATTNFVVNEIRQYLEEEVTPLLPLEWWRLNAHRFPRLAAMARDFLCIPGTSVAVERVFSTGRDAISVRRASLSAETIRTLMNYRAGIMLEKKIGHPFESEA
ncbi:HAT family dimerization protein [Rhizoctonia solani 123E]|uniref:HAT family dimerization protein n=1 Tax=Rhizoctonia solani 123E TaxID=1423351 RepID=A0A074RKH6_9AGAM|nr:HAT family dimerization protein [Rhizoctonia solani 123E]